MKLHIKLLDGEWYVILATYGVVPPMDLIEYLRHKLTNFYTT